MCGCVCVCGWVCTRARPCVCVCVCVPVCVSKHISLSFSLCLSLSLSVEWYIPESGSHTSTLRLHAEEVATTAVAFAAGGVVAGVEGAVLAGEGVGETEGRDMCVSVLCVCVCVCVSCVTSS